MPPSSAELWQFLLWGYLLTIALETPVLLLGLSRRHSWQRRLFAGFWLTACTYPIVVVLMPLTIWPLWGYTTYVVIAEIFAPLAECVLFILAFPPEQDAPRDGDSSNRSRSTLQDCAAIVVANLVSFLVGAYLFEQVR